MSIAGMGDKGLPNGMPVDEWGIRVEDRVPVGASVERGGAINSPAAIYALTTWIDFLNKYAPPESLHLDWLNFGALPARGDIAQTWYWTHIYAALNPEYSKIGSPVCNKQGEPLWRIAPVPRGRYWEEGMKIGYQDAGSWTLPNDTIGAKRHASWLWAQFCISKSVALKKFIAGVTPVRKSTLFSEYVSRNKDRYGGLIEFTRSSVRKNFTDSGPNVPHYPTLSKLWWENIAKAIKGEISAQQALDSLASQIDEKMANLSMAAYSPDLNERSDYQYWLDQPGAPKPAIDQEPEPMTIQYEDLLEQWVQ
jgi:glycerol transport system substrate-binding protein